MPQVWSGIAVSEQSFALRPLCCNKILKTDRSNATTADTKIKSDPILALRCV